MKRHLQGVLILSVSGAGSKVKEEAYQVLEALGYSRTEAMKSVSAVEMTEEMTAEELVKLALKNLM